jgi:hypothetical protein
MVLGAWQAQRCTGQEVKEAGVDGDQPTMRPKNYTEILLTGVQHAGGLAQLAAEELETLGGWDQLRSVDANLWAQLCHFIMKDAPLH